MVIREISIAFLSKNIEVFAIVSWVAFYLMYIWSVEEIVCWVESCRGIYAPLWM